MHILLTRPLEDCSNLILKFKELGHTVSHLHIIKSGRIQKDDLTIVVVDGK